MQQRPTADALLARIKDEERARLRIYVGAAPGVGKTFEMLQEAHALRARGLDVVVAYVETYGRRDTEAQLKDLEVVPRRQIDYRGAMLEHQAPSLATLGVFCAASIAVFIAGYWTFNRLKYEFADVL